jgi:hypothetical protein
MGDAAAKHVTAFALAHHEQQPWRTASRQTGGPSLFLEIAQHALVKATAQTIESIDTLGGFYHPCPAPDALVVFH